MNSVLTTMYVFTLTIPLLLQSCVPAATNPDEGACANGKIEVYQVLKPKDKAVQYDHYIYPVTKETNLYYYYGGGKVYFVQSYELTNICCKEHLKVNFRCRAEPSNSTVAISMSAEIIWNPGYPTVKRTKIVPPNSTESIDLEAGLFQKFNVNPGSADLTLTIEFESQGSLDLDIALLKDRVSDYIIFSRASKWAP